MCKYAGAGPVQDQEVDKIRPVSPFAPALYTNISPKLTLLAEQQFATRWGPPKT